MRFELILLIHDLKLQIATSNLVSPAESTDLLMEFSPVGPGCYNCEVILRGDDDIRVFRVEAYVK